MGQGVDVAQLPGDAVQQHVASVQYRRDHGGVHVLEGHVAVALEAATTGNIGGNGSRNRRRHFSLTVPPRLTAVVLLELL